MIKHAATQCIVQRDCNFLVDNSDRSDRNIHLVMLRDFVFLYVVDDYDWNRRKRLVSVYNLYLY